MRLTLGKKMIGGFMVVALLVVVAGGIGMSMIGAVSKAGDDIGQNKNPVQYAIMQTSLAVANMNEAIQRYTNEKVELAPIKKEIDYYLSQSQMWIDMVRLGTDNEEFINSPSGELYKEEQLSVAVPQGSNEVLALIDVLQANKTKLGQNLDAVV